MKRDTVTNKNYYFIFDLNIGHFVFDFDDFTHVTVAVANDDDDDDVVEAVADGMPFIG